MATAKASPETVEEAIEVLFPAEVRSEENTYLLLRLSPMMDRAIEDIRQGGEVTGCGTSSS